MFGKKKTESSPAVERAVAQGVSYEISLADRSKRSERRAWIVAGISVSVSVLLICGYMMLLPLKEKVPYLVVADPYTGTASVARLVGNFYNRDVTAEEALVKAYVGQFITARESYDSGLVGQQNWRTTLSMAGAAVAPAYIQMHSANNYERPARVYGRNKAIHVRILSIVLIGGGQGKRPTGATVRFQRSVFDKASGNSTPLDSKIATMEYTFDPNIRMNEEDRMVNPLGFRVTNYRVDNDFAQSVESPRTFDAPPAPGSVSPQSMPGQPGASIAGPGAEGEAMYLPPMPVEPAGNTVENEGNQQ